MKFLKLRYDVPKQDLISMLSDSERVNRGVSFDKFVPEMRLKRGKKRPDHIRITCRLKNTPTQDNGFLFGTYFSGKVTEKNGATILKGHIATAPFYHLVLLLFVAFFIYRCFSLGGFNPVPVVLVVFDIVLFWREFKKQGMIERYIYRAARRLSDKH